MIDKGLTKAKKARVERPSFAHRAFLVLLILSAAAIGLSCRILSPRRVMPTPTEQARRGALWTRPLLIPPEPPSGQVPDAFFVHGDKVYLANPEGYPTALDLATGEQLWQWDDRGMVYGAEPETVYVVRPDQRLYALDTQNSQTKWKTILGERSSDWPLWIAQDTVYLPFGSHLTYSCHFPFVAIDKRTGDILWWRKEIETQWGAKICAQTEQTLLVADCNEWIGLDPVTGEEKWTRPHELSDEGLSELPVILWQASTYWQASENSLFYLGARIAPGQMGWALVAVNIDTGLTLWENREPYGRIEALFPNRIYVTTWDDNLKVLNSQTGEELWSRPEPKFLAGELDGIAVLSSGLGLTWGIEASTGKTVWLNDDLVLYHLVGVSKNTLIALGGRFPESFLFGLDPATGERRWRLELEEVQVTAQPIVLIVQDRIIYGSGQTLVVLDPETGTFMFTIPLPDRPSRLIAQGDFIVVQTGSPGHVGTLSAVRP